MAAHDFDLSSIPRYVLVDYLYHNYVDVPEKDEDVIKAASDLFKENFPLQGTVSFVDNDILTRLKIQGNIRDAPVQIDNYLFDKYINDVPNNIIGSDEVLFALKLIVDSDNFSKTTYPNQDEFYAMYEKYIIQILEATKLPDLIVLTPEEVECFNTVIEYLEDAVNEKTVTLAQYAWGILYLLDTLDFMRHGTVIESFYNLHGYGEIRNCADGSESVKEFLESHRNDIVVPIIADYYESGMTNDLFFNGRSLMLFPSDIYTNLEETIFVAPITATLSLQKSEYYIVLRILYDHYTLENNDRELEILDTFLANMALDLTTYKPYDMTEANKIIIEAGNKLGLKYQDEGVEYRKRKEEERKKNDRKYNSRRNNAGSSGSSSGRNNAGSSGSSYAGSSGSSYAGSSGSSYAGSSGSSSGSSSRMSAVSNNKICNDILCPKNIRDKKDYRRWALRNHPDKGGDTLTFQNVQDCVNKEKYCDK